MLSFEMSSCRALLGFAHSYKAQTQERIPDNYAILGPAEGVGQKKSTTLTVDGTTDNPA